MNGGLPTSFQNLDRLIEALQPSGLVILTTPPSLGPVSLVHSIALNVASSSRRGVVLFSLETNRYRLVQRLLTGLVSDEEWRRVKATASMLSMAKLWIDDTVDLSIDVLQQRVKLLAERHEVALVIVDHLYRLRLSSRGNRDRDSWQDVYEVGHGLKALAHDLRIPIVAVAPLSHAIENSRYRLLQHSEMSDRPPDAGTEHILFLHRNELSPVESTSSRLIIATLLITEQRNGLVAALGISTQTERSV